MSVDLANERLKLVAFLTKHDSAKVPLGDELLKKFGPEGPAGIKKMWDLLYKRYNVTPPAGGGGAPAASPKASPPAAASPKASAGKAPAAKPSSPSLKKDPSASPLKRVDSKAEGLKTPKASSKRLTPKSGGAAKASNDDEGDDADEPTTPAAAPPPAAPASKADVAEEQRARLKRYFAKHMPDRVSQVDAIVTKMSATDKNGEGWANMWKAFTGRFGPEDPPEAASAPAPTPAAAPNNANTSAAKPLGPSSPAPLGSAPSFAASPLSVTTTSQVFSPARVDGDLKGDGSMTVRRDQQGMKDDKESVRNEWVQRVSRYLAHYDAAKPEQEVRAAVVSAEATPDGLQSLWQTLVQHYGPEPPQPISTMLKVMDAQRLKTPQEVAQSLIFGNVSKAGTTHPPDAHGAGITTSTAASGDAAAAGKRKPWYMEDEDPALLAKAVAGNKGGGNRTADAIRDAAASGNLTFRDPRADAPPRVAADALVIFGVLRLLGMQYSLYDHAPPQAQHQLLRAIEQEIAYNVDCDPNCVTVRRLIPNVVIDFKIDLSASVEAGTKDRRTAQRIGDILVNRVLNGTFTVRLIRDSYRRDLGGVASDVHPQSCAVFGNEAQQYYTLVPDDDNAQTVAPLYNSEHALSHGSSQYAAVAAAPLTGRNTRPTDVFGSSPSPWRNRGDDRHLHHSSNSPHDQHASSSQRHPADNLVAKLFATAERERAGVHEFVPQGGPRGGTGMRPTNNTNYHDAYAPQQRPRTPPTSSGYMGNGRSGDFTTRMWDDTASEVPDYSRREETSQYDLDKPEVINSTYAWNHILQGFSDPAKVRARQSGLVGANHVPRPANHSADLSSYSPLPRNRAGSSSPKRPLVELRGLQRIASPVRNTPHTTATKHQHSPKERFGTSSSSPHAAYNHNKYNRDTPAYATDRRPSPRQQPGPRSLVEQRVTSSHHQPHEQPSYEEPYRGFGREVPEIRNRVEQQQRGFGARQTNPYAAPNDGSHHFPSRVRAPSYEQQQPGAVGHSSTSWPTDGFSRQYNSIVRSLGE